VKKKRKEKLIAKIRNKNRKHKVKYVSKYIILDKNMKVKLVEEAKMTSVSEVSKKYGISINNICRWKKTCDRKRGAGRKITNVRMEEELI
jgi:Tc5 transposase DNA-binding domain